MQEKKRKQAETERKRAEVRARLEEASKAKKAKKGFMTPDRKKKLRVSSTFCFFPFEFDRATPSEFSRDILFKELDRDWVAANLSSYFSFPLMEIALMLRQGFQKYVLYCIDTFVALECSFIDSQVELLPFPIYLIASSHAIIFSRVVRELLGNIAIILFALFARRFSHEIFLVTATSISLLLSPILLATHPSRFNALFSSRPGTGVRNFLKFISPFYLYFMVPPYGSPFCFHRRVTSCETSMQLPSLPPPFDSPSFLFMHRREHSQ